MEIKSTLLELKDVDTSKRTAVIAHAVYHSIDRVGDISMPGMFTKSWQENKTVDFLFNHVTSQIPGNTVRTFEDNERAYTEVKFGNWTLGNDVLEMADAKVLRGASFGYETLQKEFTEVKGKRIRRLKEVKHFETSLLTVLPAHPDAGVVSLNKSEDIKNMITELKQHIGVMEQYCRSAKASDETIKALYADIKSANDIISKYDTVTTDLINQPDASRNDNDSFRRKLLLLTSKF